MDKLIPSGLTNKRKIHDAIKSLYDNLSLIPHEKCKVIYATQGGSKQLIDVCYSRIDDFWWGTILENGKEKFWNPVGFGHPLESPTVTGDCEFNCLENGFKSSYSSLFAKDSKDNIYLLHKGTVGGNRPNATIKGFCEFYKEIERQQVLVDKRLYNYFVVSNIDSDDLLKNMINYARAIASYKNHLKP